MERSLQEKPRSARNASSVPSSPHQSFRDAVEDSSSGTPAAEREASHLDSQRSRSPAEEASSPERNNRTQTVVDGLADLTDAERQDLLNQLDPIVAAQVCLALPFKQYCARQAPVGFDVLLG